MAKQTVEKDFEQTNHADCLLYTHFEFMEFLEIIARVADIQSKGTNFEGQFLHTKIESLLGQILRIAGLQQKIKKFSLDMLPPDSSMHVNIQETEEDYEE